MAWENVDPENLDTLSAAANLTGKEGYLLNNTSGQASLAAGATRPLTVCYLGAAQGRSVTRQKGGLARVVCGGTIAAEAFVTSNASGQGVATTTTGDRYVGVAREAGVAGQVISVDVQPGVI